MIAAHRPLRRDDAGQEFHCDHGAFTRVTRMLDWRPFHYMTNVTVQSYNKLPFKAPQSMVTFELTPVDAGHTKLSFRVRCLRRDWFIVQFMRRIARHVFNKENNGDYTRLDKVLAEMQAENKES